MSKRNDCDKQYSFVFKSLLITGKLTLSRFFLSQNEPEIEQPTNSKICQLDLQAKPRVGSRLQFALTSRFEAGEFLSVEEKSGAKINHYSLSKSDLLELDGLPFFPVLNLAFEILESQTVGTFLAFVGRDFAEINSVQSQDAKGESQVLHVSAKKTGDERIQKAQFIFEQNEIKEIIVESPLGKFHLKRVLDSVELE